MADRPVDLGHLGTVAVGTVDVVLTERAPAQKGSGMNLLKTVLGWGALLAFVLWLGAGLYYYYGNSLYPPMLWPFGSARENMIQQASFRLQQQQFNGFVLTTTTQPQNSQQGFGNVPGVWTSHGPDSCKQFGLTIGQETVVNGQRIVCGPDQ